MKGIVLAGGTGSRLWPMTKSLSKQLLPIYDKPLLYYPISTLMLAGIREILIITTPVDLSHYERLLGDGSQFGVTFKFETQHKPNGLAEALIIAENFLGGDESMMILGDNFFYGAGLGQELNKIRSIAGSHVFLTKVKNPSDYGVMTLDENLQPESIIEKPTTTNSPWAVTGLYIFDNNASAIAKNVTPSLRGELEITSVLNDYLARKKLSYTILNRGNTWLDTGTPENLLEASNFVRIIEQRSGLKIACLEEIAWTNGWINDLELSNCAKDVGSSYSEYLLELLN